MADTNQLRLTFATAAGDKTWTFNYAKEEATTQQVKNLMDVMIANGSIYRFPPLAKVSAQLVKIIKQDYIITD